jgi:hypothetical protein
MREPQWEAGGTHSRTARLNFARLNFARLYLALRD